MVDFSLMFSCSPPLASCFDEERKNAATTNNRSLNTITISTIIRKKRVGNVNCQSPLTMFFLSPPATLDL
jgi:hypothetical protein